VVVNVPANVASGIYYLVAVADADNVEAETLESNNTFPRLVSIGPDLAIPSLTGPTTAAAGGIIVVTDTVKNQGGGAAAASTTRFYFSTNASLDAGDVLLAGSRSVPSLAAGATSTGSTVLQIPANAPTGTSYLIAKADADNEQQETQEWNNTAVKVLQVGGDLVVSALTVPSNFGADSTIVVSDTTANTGSGSVAASVTRFYLSRSGVLDASAISLPGGRDVPELAAGTSSTGSTTLVVPSNVAAGIYYFVAKADADNAVVETQEFNNTTPRLVTIGGDLVVSALNAPSSSGSGATIVITDTTANLRAGGVAASTTRFYLSRDTILDTSDTPLPGARAVPPLAGNASSSGSTTLALPTTIAAGAYYIIAKADADNAVVETQETNNTMAKALTIGPDLIVSSIALPFGIAAGATVSVTDVVQNAGGDAVGPSTTRFYLSTNLDLDAGDLLLNGSRAVPALAAGASSSGTTSITIPATTVPGRYYYVIAVADADGVVAEGQENNNTLLRAIFVVPGS
jgi:subtilase family serine protease